MSASTVCPDDFLSIDPSQLDAVSGGWGAWSWKAFGKTTAKGAVLGAVGGAVAGSLTGPGVVASAGIGAVAGAATGAVDYTGTQLGVW